MNDSNDAVRQHSVGIFLAEILTNFGLVFDDDASTGNKLVLSSYADEEFNLKPVVELSVEAGGRKSFYCGGELIFDYDPEAIYLPKPIKSHDLMCRIMELCGWRVTYVGEDKVSDHCIRISSAISPVTYNTVLILSDHRDGVISETRVNYLNKILISIAISDDKVLLYTTHKDVDAAVYKIIIENK